MKKSVRTKELETILVLVIALGVLYWRYKATYYLLAGFLLGITGVFFPAAGAIIHSGWMKMAEWIGFVMNRVLLTIVFFILVIPLGWLSRTMRKSSIQLKPGGDSYFKKRDQVFTSDDMKHPW